MVYIPSQLHSSSFCDKAIFCKIFALFYTSPRKTHPLFFYTYDMLFKSFIMSRIAYCLLIIFTCIYASDKKAIRKIFKDCSKLGIEYLNIDLHIQKLTKELAIKYIVDNDNFINNLLSQYPSGRYRTIKYRGAWGRDSFLRHLVNTLNEFLF